MPNGRELVPTMKLETITPQVAVNYLTKNTHNRAVRQRHLEKLVHAMKNGQWQVVGDPIRFSKSGVLLDGQHRLSAVITSATPQKMYVIRGLPDESFSVIDQGKNRSGMDILHLAGYKNVAGLAAALALLYRVKVGALNFGTLYSVIPTAQDLVEMAGEHPGLETSVTYINGSRLKRMGSLSVYAFCHFLFSKIDQDKSTRFFDDLVSGENLTKENVVYHLRERLVREKKNVGLEWKKGMLLAMVIKAWNKYDTPCKGLRMLQPDEKFPLINGIEAVTL